MTQTEAFRLLASADRQLVLHELCEEGGDASISELSERIAARRHRLSPDKISDKQVERARVRLVHAHLPKLSEADIINHDVRDNTVVLNEDESVARLFDAADEIDGWPPTDLLEHPARRR
ncbi:hypothetical protein GS429_06695 [Natronorubrum sp. JWXQ-INN-674]|uniref:DUF7344 domain-containing protein n=1 Tax=Natronorubrum halalkaliphilum TaxID=2691917 RepID=A0A6B0VJR5_9EURY|nr:hypothetical protein [Natronorubrum halalkaliphilum]